MEDGVDDGHSCDDFTLSGDGEGYSAFSEVGAWPCPNGSSPGMAHCSIVELSDHSSMVRGIFWLLHDLFAFDHDGISSNDKIRRVLWIVALRAEGTIRASTQSAGRLCLIMLRCLLLASPSRALHTHH